MTAEARVARVAYLLSGSVRGAAEVIDRVQRAQPRLESVTPEHRDRLVVLHAREWAAVARRRKPKRVKPPRSTAETFAAPSGAASEGESSASTAGPISPDPARECHEAALAMDRQHAEAWLFRHIDDMDDAQISRAMDSSKKATQRHLEAAEVAMHARLGERLLPATAALREHVRGLEADAFAVERREIRRERLKRRGIVVASVVAAALIVAIVAWAVVF